MSVSELTAIDPKNGLSHGWVYPCGTVDDWQAICTEPDAVETDPGVVVGGKVVDPSRITRATQKVFRPGSGATHLLIALKYNSDNTSLTDPVVRAFGCDRSGVWHPLANSSGSVELTIASAITTDALHGTANYKVTKPVQVDLQGSHQVVVGIQTAYSDATGTKTDSEILVKTINSR